MDGPAAGDIAPEIENTADPAGAQLFAYLRDPAIFETGADEAKYDHLADLRAQVRFGGVGVRRGGKAKEQGEEGDTHDWLLFPVGKSQKNHWCASILTPH